MARHTLNAAHAWPAPIAGGGQRALQARSVAAHMLVAIVQRGGQQGLPEAALLTLCRLQPSRPAERALILLEDRDYVQLADEGWRATQRGHAMAAICLSRGTRAPREATQAVEPTPPQAAASVFAIAPPALPMPPLPGSGITRLAHCLGGRLDDGSSGNTAGRQGGDDWREHPSRQGDWLVYRDGRRVAVPEAMRARRSARP